MEDSTPLATVQDIGKRLLRPPSLHSPLELGVKLKQSGSRVKRKLEDYLDPVLVAAVSAKIGGAKKAKAETRSKREFEGIEWPAEELKVFVEGNSRNAKRASLRNGEAVDLNNDSDAIGDGGGGEEEEDDEEIGSPFRRLEKTALKILKR